MQTGAIDAHLHLWDTTHLNYGWRVAIPPINKPKNAIRDLLINPALVL